jgi:hypothetical protein
MSIAPLLTYQPWIGPIVAPMPMTEAELLQWCLPETFGMQGQASISGVAPNRWECLFETNDRNAVFGPISGGFAFGVQPRLNWVQVATSGDRSLVLNGNHRLALLASAGLTEVPVLHRPLASLKEVVPNEPGVFSYEQVSADRPPMICDFLNPDLTFDVPSPPQRRLMQVRVEMVEHRLP